MGSKNGNDFAKLLEEVRASRAVQEKTLEIQRSMLDEMRELRTGVVASVERVIEGFVATVASKSEQSDLERRVALLEKSVFPQKT